MRTSDVHEIHSHLLTVIPAAKGLPRRYRTVLQTTKNDPDGTGPIANREYFVPCDCLTRLTAAEKRSFTMKVKANPDHPCEFPTCPFHDYLTLCPSPFGTEGRILKFMRARTTQGNVGFTLGTMGKHKIVEMMARLNSLLPPHLQVARVTGHSGRHTAASIAVNSGVDSSMIAKVTPTALAISEAVSGKPVDFEDDAAEEVGVVVEPPKVIDGEEENAFLEAWRVGQKRFHGVYHEIDDEDQDGPVAKGKKATVNNFTFTNKHNNFFFFLSLLLTCFTISILLLCVFRCRLLHTSNCMPFSTVSQFLVHAPFVCFFFTSDCYRALDDFFVASFFHRYSFSFLFQFLH